MTVNPRLGVDCSHFATFFEEHEPVKPRPEKKGQQSMPGAAKRKKK